MSKVKVKQSRSAAARRQFIGGFGRVMPWCRVLTRLPFSFWLSRLDYTLRKLYYRSPFYRFVEEEADVPEAPILTPPQLWPKRSSQAKSLLKNTFTFMNREVAMGEDMDWMPKGVSQDWLSRLHSFAWLRHLRAHKGSDNQKQEAVKKGRELITSYLEQCGEFHPLRWHPYILSSRLVHWLEHADWLLKDADPTFKKDFMGAINWHANHLPKVLEWDMGGHHLIRNLKGLIVSSLCLPGRQSTYLESLDLLREQLAEQILHDGMHYQRSPYYHSRVLEDILDIHAIIVKAGQHPPAELDDVIERMAQALQFMRHGDGSLALFNDGDIGNPAALDDIIKRCGVGGKLGNELAYAGYVRMQQKDMCLLFDGGKLGPDDHLQNAHADTFSFELSYDGERLFTNSGTYHLLDQEKLTFRGSKAHNSLTIDGHGAAEVVGCEFIGRRPKKITYRLQEEAAMGVGIDAKHDGFKHLGCSYARKLFMAANGEDLRGEDTVESKSKQSADVRFYFHAHPAINVELIDNHQAMLTTRTGDKLLFRIKGGHMQLSESFYAPRLGERTKRPVLVVKGLWKNQKITLNWGLKVQS